jgi:hypothetical protein
MKCLVSLGLSLLLALPVIARADEPAKTDKPDQAKTDQPVPDDVKKLIEQLGDNAYAKREAAAAELKEIGKPALAALKQAISRNEDPEVVARAQALVKRIEIRPIPGIDPNFNGGVHTTRMQMSVMNGKRVIDVSENGRDIKIEEGNDGIAMSVTGLVEGQRVTEEFTAKDPAQLKADNPPAGELYERWMNSVGHGILMRGPIRVAGGGAVQFNLQPPVPDEIELLRAGLEKQMRDAKLKAADRDVINKGIEQLADARNAGPVGMEKYTEQCDEFRKTLAKYKLDAGELLPPPAKSRLGISVATENGHVLVQSVSDKSRAQRLGVQAGDEIRKVDGKAISDVGELRKATIAKEKGMIMEITRDGKELKLEEKEEKK